jgi:hypothetical protein
MNKLILAIAILLISPLTLAFEIYAVGASYVNCKNVDTPQKFTSQLELLLKAKNINATVINGGVDGDKIPFIYNRMVENINPETRIIIYQAGGNMPGDWIKMQYLDKTLSMAVSRNIAVIAFGSTEYISPEFAMEHKSLTDKYGGYYYGSIIKDIPLTGEYWQMDKVRASMPHGHMTAKGCQLWAENMLPIVLQAIRDYNIK